VRTRFEFHFDTKGNTGPGHRTDDGLFTEPPIPLACVVGQGFEVYHLGDSEADIG
jgi:hypothetical protein